MTIGDRRREMGLGGYPDVTLARARENAREARDLLRRGSDPIAEARKAKLSLKAKPPRVTFSAAAAAYISAHEAGWKNPKHRDQWRATLAKYAYPVVGNLDVSEVELSHVMRILEPIWLSRTETAMRLRGRIEMVLDWAAARGHREDANPARWKGHLDKLLAQPSKVRRVVHHRALPARDLPAFLNSLRAVEGMGARALQFAILTGARSGEVRGATWDEIDEDDRLWCIPASRMKAARDHRVPLSAAALAVLKSVKMEGRSGIVFPAPSGNALSDMTLSAVMRRMNVDAVPHGFRSTFRDWIAEETSYPNEVAEMALAHTVGSKVEAAYRRGDLFERRRALMDDWARFCLNKPLR